MLLVLMWDLQFKLQQRVVILQDTGELKGAAVAVGDYLKLLSSNNSLSSLGGYDVLVVPDTGRIADVLTNTAIAIPVGTTAERPTAGIVKDGCIRYNTDTNQYEGYSTNSYHGHL